LHDLMLPAPPMVVGSDRHPTFPAALQPMSERSQASRQAAGNGSSNGRPAAPNGAGRDSAAPADGITPAQLMRGIRENLPLFLVTAGLTMALAGFVIFRSPSEYSARAVIRMASERRTLTSGVENAPQILERPVDPLLSAVQVLTSRTLVGSVVDSLGLRLQPVSTFSLDAPLFGRRLPVGALQLITVDSIAPVDTLLLRFAKAGVTARSRRHHGAAPYGDRLRVGPVSLSVPELPPVGYAVLAIERRDVTIDQALRRLKVTTRPGTDVIDVRYVHPDPQLAQQFANRLVRLFQSANGHSAQDQARRRREFLSEQLQVTDSLLLKAEAGLSHFRSRQQLGSSRDNLSAAQASATALEAQQAQLRADRRVLAGLVQRVRGSGHAAQADGFRALAYAPEVAADPILATLQQRLIDYRSRLDSLTTGPWRSLATHPDVVQLSTLLQTTREELLRAVQARVASLDARIAVLSNQQARGDESIEGLPAKQAMEASLDRRVEVLRSTADALRQEYQKARISEALGAADIEILDLAPLPYRKTGIPRSVQVVFGLLLGLAFGGAVAVLAEVTNRSVRRPEELLGTIGTTELAVIPRIARLQAAVGSVRQLPPSSFENGNGHDGSSDVVFGPAGTLSPEAEAFRLLRISLAFSWGDRPCTLVVTSAAPQEGKTLIATNLAATFARGGAHVLLVDCDIHRPRLHRVFHLSRAPGLMDLLRIDTGGLNYETARRVSRSQRASAVRKTSIERLSLLPCGADAQSSPELLEPATLRGLLLQLKTEYDVIVLDTPPVLVSADAATLAASADGVIMVVRAGQTDRGAAELARQRVSSAGGHVLGAVLNDPDGLVGRFDKSYYAYDYPATVE
jgi:succinoglycan biosynthesis transport protein ExoP